MAAKSSTKKQSNYFILMQLLLSFELRKPSFGHILFGGRYSEIFSSGVDILKPKFGEKFIYVIDIVASQDF